MENCEVRIGMMRPQILDRIREAHSSSTIMDIAATLDGITALSVEERIRIVQAILESISVEQSYPELTLELKQELDRRSRAYDANPDDVMTREEMWTSIRRR